MRDLLELKRETIAKHLPKILEQKRKANEELMKLMTKAITDEKMSAKVGFSIINKINAEGKVGSESSNEMTGEQRLELAKLWFENAKNSMNSLDSDIKSNYDSYMRSIDDQMELLHKEIESINSDIAKAKDAEEKERLMIHRNHALERV